MVERNLTAEDGFGVIHIGFERLLRDGRELVEICDELCRNVISICI